MSDLGAPYRPGRPEEGQANGQPVMTGMRRITADSGSAFVNGATATLGVLGAGLLYVSFAAQYSFILSQKPGQRPASIIEALMLDAGMITFSFLALGLAKKGLPARAERAWIMVCAGLSAAMNYAASDTASWRSVAVYVIAPVFLAGVTDRVIAGVRRHVLGPTETSAWATLGRALAAATRMAGQVLLYVLRFFVDRRGTLRGVRAAILNATPLPEAVQHYEAAPCVNSAPGRADAPEAAEVPDPVRLPRLAAPPASAIEPSGGELNGRAGPGALAVPRGRRPAADGVPPGRETAAGPVTDEMIEADYAAGACAGQVPSGKAIRRRWHVGSVRADHIHIRLTARHLANLPAGELPAAVAALPADDVGEVRDILGAQLPGHGTDFGPNATTACQACTAALDALSEGSAGYPAQRQASGTPG